MPAVSSPHRVLSSALALGERMLVCGAEVGRVENTLNLTLHAMGAVRTEVFSITNNIIATIEMPNGSTYTQSKRIRDGQYHLQKLEALNQLSRDICAGFLTPGDIDKRLAAIDDMAPWPVYIQLLIYPFIACVLSLFFGGSFIDAAAAAIASLAVFALQQACKEARAYRFLTSLLSALAGGVAAMLLVRCGIGEHIDKICIGNVMLLIPGLALTNGVRDLFSGDTVSGLMRLADALLTALAVGFGFVFAAVLTGGAL
ncbi:MAG: threonine/serine exporter family protein [Oscillospiraceae bacterium]|nr:threonine/serine exporter family protein [Oscillospiraceae bacterium]